MIIKMILITKLDPTCLVLHGKIFGSSVARFELNLFLSNFDDMARIFGRIEHVQRLITIFKSAFVLHGDFAHS